MGEKKGMNEEPSNEGRGMKTKGGRIQVRLEVQESWARIAGRREMVEKERMDGVL